MSGDTSLDEFGPLGAGRAQPGASLAFGDVAAGDIAAAVRGVMLRDLAVITLRAHAQWQLPYDPEDGGQKTRPFDVAALGMARAISSLSLALKRVSGRDVLEAPADTLAPALTGQVHALLSAAVNRENELRRRPAAMGGRGDETDDTGDDLDSTLFRAERRLYPHQPERWSDGARGEVGLPPLPPAARLKQQRLVLQEEMDDLRRNLDELRAEERALEPRAKKKRETEERMGPGPGAAHEDGENPRPFAQRHRPM